MSYRRVAELRASEAGDLGSCFLGSLWGLNELTKYIKCLANYLIAQRLKHLPAMWETWVWSLDWEDPLEKEMATHSSILAWRIPWKEEPGGLQSTGSQRVRHDWVTSLSLSFHFSQLPKPCCCCCITSVMSDSVQPHRWQPTRLPVPGILLISAKDVLAVLLSIINLCQMRQSFFFNKVFLI